jgi:hypothetical protein
VHKQINELGIDNFGTQTLSDYQSIQAFSRHTADMLAYISDKLVPRDFDRQAKEGFSEIVKDLTGSPATPCPPNGSNRNHGQKPG